jgi:hypothetical protein
MKRIKAVLAVIIFMVTTPVWAQDEGSPQATAATDQAPESGFVAGTTKPAIYEKYDNDLQLPLSKSISLTTTKGDEARLGSIGITFPLSF